MATAPAAAAVQLNANGWHPGEVAAHALLKVQTSRQYNPTNSGLAYSHGYRVSESPLVAVGTLDVQGRPWTSLLGGEKGFARPVAKNVLAMQSLVDSVHDPVVRAFFSGAGEKGEEIARLETGKMMSGLSVDLETRDRVKVAGKMVVASCAASNNEVGVMRKMQMAMVVEEALGNCPKYMNRKEIRAHLPRPELVSDGELPLPPQALKLLEKADMFFLSTTNGETMDTNHRGGEAGFVRVLSNDAEEVVLVYPEYSGNQLYQSLGNLQVRPLIGVVVPDYETSDVLYLTGETELLVGGKAAEMMPHAKVVVKIIVKEARFVRDGLSFRGTKIDQSPYNPPVRRLAREGLPAQIGGGANCAITATLLRKETLSRDIARFTFLLQQQKVLWKPGQYVTLDFSAELDHGWSHMRDDDPQSLNDDFVRTFTVSSPPPPFLLDGKTTDTELEITVRRHGPATGLLWSHRLGPGRVPLELPVLGFGGDESFRIPTSGDTNKAAIFIAGGVGITPLLTQAPGLLLKEPVSGEKKKKLRVLWSLRGQDLGLAVDTFERIPGLAAQTQLFITGSSISSEETLRKPIERVKELGVQGVLLRRLLKDDVLGARDAENGTKFYLCASPEMQKIVNGWLHGEEVVYESFNY
ncbi:hypothetical protein B0H66DRAFT_277377 [Apodospora peruviana]|uniref:FAD-binding FR-type domain-containing protein n=1 Tax=Apodospora peruviana TaxID=516989 RepID=A0AAE0I0D6_9PEZI|nr:hypothetical protein B0H66DRAFT_277377 [Apodospora peruviana]